MHYMQILFNHTRKTTLTAGYLINFQIHVKLLPQVYNI